eukprot:7137352-Prymnesium_polylepis.1
MSVWCELPRVGTGRCVQPSDKGRREKRQTALSEGRAAAPSEASRGHRICSSSLFIASSLGSPAPPSS